MNSTDSITITSIDSITLEVADPEAARRFYADAFGLGDVVRLRATDAPTTGFRGFTVSLIVSQPADVQGAVRLRGRRGSDRAEGGREVHVGVRRRCPGSRRGDLADRDVEKKDTGPATREIDNIVVLLGAEDVSASKKFYVERGLAVGKSFGSYVDFATPVEPDRAGALQAPRARQGRRRPRRGHRIAPDPAQCRRRVVHRPRGVRLGVRGGVSRAGR